MNTKKLDQLLEFVRTLNDFKSVERLSLIKETGRRESDAEHSWHLCMSVWLFANSFEKRIDLLKAFKIALIHDLVEIYAGDVWAFDEEGRVGKEERERAAAQKLFSKLPPELQEEFHQIWEEYELRQTNEALYVWSLDKIHPRLQYLITKGGLADGRTEPLDKIKAQDDHISSISRAIGYILRKLRQEKMKQKIY